MILILIPIAWFALAAFVVLLCRMAARSDAALAHRAPQRAAHLAPIPAVTLSRRARWQDTPYVAGSRAALAWAPRGRATRTRQGRCIAGS